MTLPISNCQMPIGRFVKTPIGNRKSTIGNEETHPLSRHVGILTSSGPHLWLFPPSPDGRGVRGEGLDAPKPHPTLPQLGRANQQSRPTLLLHPHAGNVRVARLRRPA